MKLITAAEMRQLEEEAMGEGTSVRELMERAGKGVAQTVRHFLDGAAGKRVLVLVGPGNNGGDGLVAARYLAQWGVSPYLYLCPTRLSTDPLLSPLQPLPQTTAQEDTQGKSLKAALRRAGAVIDALLGTGATPPLRSPYREVLGWVGEEKHRHPGLPIIALDLPSGLHPDTGAVDEATPWADLTVTLGYPKRGLFAFPGAARVGKLEVVDIGLPIGEGIPTQLLTPSYVRSLLPARPLNAHKGTFGRVLVVAGSEDYIGAAYLACSGAYRVGAGLVALAAPRSLHPILAAKLTEAIHLPLPEAEIGALSPTAGEVVAGEAPNYQALLIGPGLGQHPATAQFMEGLLPRLTTPVCLWDADALNLLARLPRWWQRLPPGGILTPHPAELSRLSGIPVEQVQADRIEVSRKMAQEWGQIVVLKGAYTVVASPQGQVALSPFANPGLASAGTGDVLAGAIAGLAAQGLPPFAAAAVGVYLHALAGEQVRKAMGEAGMVAGDLLPALPQAIKDIKETTDARGVP